MQAIANYVGRLLEKLLDELRQRKGGLVNFRVVISGLEV